MSIRQSSGQLKRGRWFDLGSKAAGFIWPGLPHCYVCPLCGIPYLPSAIDSGNLTFEHAPPKSLGGKEVVLTCRDCNNRAGYRLDNETRVREDQLDFLCGNMDRPLPAYFEVEGDTINVLVQRSGSGIQISSAETRNDPEVYGSFLSRMEQTQDPKFNVTLRKGFQHGPAVYGLLRSAYLIAFAALGYRYAFSPQLRQVRQQLADTDANVITVFSITDPRANKQERRILLVQEPNWLTSLAVQFGRHLIFLPPFEGGEDLYEDLATENGKGHAFESRMSGKVILWPSSPQHALDWPESNP